MKRQQLTVMSDDPSPATRRSRAGSRCWIFILIAILSIGTFPAAPTSAGINEWTGIGPEGGDIMALAIDPVTPDTLYAGMQGGIYKSTDGAASWSHVNTGLTNASIHALAIDAANPSTIYAGSDDGVFKSTDGGANWNPTNTGIPTSRVEALVSDPTNPATLYAGQDSVYKSSNGGASWTLANAGLNSSFIRALAIDPITSTTLYAGTDDGVFKSTNGGADWEARNTGLSTLTVKVLAVNPITPATVYAGIDGGLFKSTNGGISWTVVMARSTYALAINPTNPAIVYAGASGGVYKSTNDGASWEAVNNGLAVRQIRTLAVNPANPTTLYAGASGGVYKSTNGGTSWTAVISGILQAAIAAIAIDPATPQTLYAGTSGGGISKSTDGGKSWNIVNTGLTSFWITALIVDRSTPTIIYAGTHDGVYKSTNSGASWTALGPKNLDLILDVTSLAVDPATPTTIYAGGRREFVSITRGVYVSSNGGASWSAFNDGLTNTQVNALAIDPETPATLYAGTDGGVFKRNGSSSWGAASQGIPGTAKVYALAIDPLTPNTLFAGTSNGIYRSTDGGVNWSGVLTESSINALAIDPATPTTILAGRPDGIYRSVDGGATWGPFNPGLTTTNVKALAIDPVHPTNLYAGTNSGVFAMQNVDEQRLVYARVLRQDGQPIASAQVYHNGRLVTDALSNPQVTDAAGNLVLSSVEPGDTLVALAPLHEQPTVREHHNGWAYRVYGTSLDIANDGTPQPFIVMTPTGQQRLAVKPETTLILFNLIVSVEWDAQLAYLQDLERAVQQAAAFLYDATDGQMTFGQVQIYDWAEHWADADIQVSAKNIVHPHAYVGGLTDDDPAHLIRVGRSWDGNSGNQGSWSAQEGFRTLVHEFGHYGLGLYDEYFGYKEEGGDLAGRRDSSCTDPSNRTNPEPAGGASIMDYHYATSELADRGRWTTECQQTAQHQLNNGEADWETLLRLYSDPVGQARWRLVTPDERAGFGQAVAGPATLAASLPFPLIETTNAGADPTAADLTVCYNNAPYRDGAWVTLHFGGKAMDQGLTSETTGELRILGARPSDELRVVSLDGTLSGVAQVQPNVTVHLAPPATVSLQNTQAMPYLRLWPTTSGGQLDGLRLVATRTLPTDKLQYALTGADKIGPADTITYDAGRAEHRVQVSFIPEALSGHARILGAHAGQTIDMNADYRLQQANRADASDLYSNDGNLKLHLDAASLDRDQVYFAITSPWGLPGPLPAGQEIVGEAYDITAANDVTSLVRPAVLRLRYDPAAGSTFNQLGIYRWDFQINTWQPLASSFDAEHQEMVTSVTNLGIYALLGTPGAAKTTSLNLQASTGVCGSSSNTLYLPLVVQR
ncbi:MAG: hypothetical protein MI924_28635 [Chloroflexales bacterium]|nr:hypothetical protein [Chloroflexales bacterium]